MAHLSDFDLCQMDDSWQSRQPEAVVRSLLTRTLDDLRVARDRLNQNPKNSSCPSGSTPPWQVNTDTDLRTDKFFAENMQKSIAMPPIQIKLNVQVFSHRLTVFFYQLIFMGILFYVTKNKYRYKPLILNMFAKSLN